MHTLRMYSHISLALLTLFPAQSFAQEPTAPSPIEQKILFPNRDSVLTAGTTFIIQWTADTHFSNVTLELWDKTSWGYSRDFGSLCYHWVNPFCGTIVSHAPNTGSYAWSIPKPGSEFPRRERVFWIKMYVDDYLHPEIGNTSPVLSYSSNFAFAPEPGTPGEGFSVPAEQSTAVPDVQQSTVWVTVHDPASTAVETKGGTTTKPFNVSATAAPKRNITDSIPMKGSGVKIERVIPAILSLFLGWL